MNEKDYFNRLKNVPDYCIGCTIWQKADKHEKAYALIDKFDKWLKEQKLHTNLEDVKNKWEEFRKPKSRAEAKAYLKALYANESKK